MRSQLACKPAGGHPLPIQPSTDHALPDCPSQLLLRNGADINVATAEGTALHAAASRCCHRAVSLLLRW